MKVLLLNPPGNVIRTGRWVRRSRANQSWPPIFLAYAAGVLEKMGYEVKLHDAAITGETPDQTLEMAKGFGAEAAAVYWAYDTRDIDLPFAERLSKLTRVFLVGPWSPCYPGALKECPGVEAMTWGQFEYTLPSLIEKRPAEGVTYRDGTHIPQGEPYTRAQLDWMPHVTDVYRRHLDMRLYRQTSFLHPFIDLFTARSCPYRCSYCQWIHGMDQLHPRRYQQRSLRSVMDELWEIKENMPWIRQVFFQDSTLVKPRAVEITDAILSEGLKMTWGCYSRADRNYEELRRMKEAGLRTLHVGYEVPIQSVLDEVHKDITVAQMEEFAHAVKRLDLYTSSAFMIMPWETRAQVEETVAWIRRVKPKRINLVQLQPYPNTPIVDTINAYRDLPGRHVMGFEEARRLEQWGLKEYHINNPGFWVEVLRHPGEWRQVASDAWGLLRFLGEK